MLKHVINAMGNIYRDCQKYVPIEGHISATSPYAAVRISEHYFDKRYKSYDTKCRGDKYQEKLKTSGINQFRRTVNTAN